MIIIKDKLKKTEVFVPRTSDFDVSEYITEKGLESYDDSLKAYIEQRYASKEYVNVVIGNINNVLEEIIN
jgi:hypothetical protein